MIIWVERYCHNKTMVCSVNSDTTMMASITVRVINTIKEVDIAAIVVNIAINSLTHWTRTNLVKQE